MIKITIISKFKIDKFEFDFIKLNQNKREKTLFKFINRLFQLIKDQQIIYENKN